MPLFGKSPPHLEKLTIHYVFLHRYATKESACQAICHIHGAEIHGYTVKCGWGRDESTSAGNNSMPNYNNNQYDSVRDEEEEEEQREFL